MNGIAKECIMETIETNEVIEFLEKLKPLMIQKNKIEVFKKIEAFFEYGELRLGMIYVYKFLNENPRFINEPLQNELEDFYSEYVN